MSKSFLAQSPPAPPGWNLIPFKQAPISKHIAKSRYLLAATIDNFFRRHPVTHAAFATLTFPTPVNSPAEAHRRLNSFLNALRKRGLKFIWVLEPHQKEGLHYHILVALPFDCHEGTRVEYWADKSVHDDDGLKRQVMNPKLLAEYDWWTAIAPRYGFGRIDLAPIYSNAEAIRKYLTKTEWRHDHWVFAETIRLRFWNCSRGLKSGGVNFSWNTTGGKVCRTRMAAWAADYGCNSREAIRTKLGRSWGWQYRCDTIAHWTPSAPAPLSYLLVPSGLHDQKVGEAASAAETAKQVENRQAGSPPDEGFKCLGRRRRQATDTEKSRPDARACRVRTAPSLSQIPPPLQWRRGPTDAREAPLSVQSSKQETNQKANP